MRRLTVIGVAATLLILVFTLPTATASWLTQVGLPLTTYNYTGHGVVVAVVSTGFDPSDPLVASRVATTYGGVKCAVTVDTSGVVTLGALDEYMIGSVQARLILEAAPNATLIIVKVPLATCNGLPCPEPKALEAALNWLLSPRLLVNGTYVSCPKPDIVLIGVPLYNVTLSSSLESLLEKLYESSLVIVPVGDLGPGVLNALAYSRYTISVSASTAPIQSSGLSTWGEPLQADLPIEPDYSMPVDVTCAYGSAAAQPVLTCSEAAAAELAGLAAVLYQAFQDLRAAPPLSHQLEHVIRASVVDIGALVAKDSRFGWGVPNARIAVDMLAANSRVEVCASTLYKTRVIVEVESHNGVYGGYVQPGSCLTLYVEPGEVRVTVFGGIDTSPWNTTIVASAGRTIRVLAPMISGLSIAFSARVFNEYGVALDYTARILPGMVVYINDRLLPFLASGIHVEGGVLLATVSCSLLSYAGIDNLYLVLSSPGYIPRVYKFSLQGCALRGYGDHVDLGDVRMVKAPKVLVVGDAVDAEVLASILNDLGIPAYTATPDYVLTHNLQDYGVVVLAPGSQDKAYMILEAARSAGVRVVALGDTLRSLGCARPLQAYVTPGVMLEIVPRLTPNYGNALKARGVYTLWPLGVGAKLTLYNVTVTDPNLVLAFSVGVGINGRLVEIAYIPGKSVTAVANLWYGWSRGLNPRYYWSIEAKTALVLSIASAYSRLSLVLSSTAIQPLANITVSVVGYRLAVTIFNETLRGGVARVYQASTEAPLGSTSFTLNVGLVPFGSYRVYANDSLWGIAYAEYIVYPVLQVLSKRVKAGGSAEILAMGLPAVTVVKVSLDNITIAVASTNARGVLRASVVIPSTTPPGEHTIGVEAAGVTAMGVIEVYVERVLNVRIVSPPVVQPGGVYYALILTSVGGEPVDPTSIQVSINGRLVNPIRITRGVYRVVLDTSVEGAPVLFVNASYVSRFIVAKGYAAISYTVLREFPAPLEVYREEISKLISRINEVAENATILYQRLEDTLAALNKSIHQLKADMEESIAELSKRLDEKLNTIISSQKSLSGSTLRIAEELAALKAQVSTTTSKLSKEIDDAARRVTTDVRTAIGGSTATIVSKINEISKVISESCSLVKAVNQRQLYYMMLMLGLLAADTAIVIVVLVKMLRARK